MSGKFTGVSRVSLVDATKFINLQEAIAEALKLINFKLDQKTKTVAIKLNLNYYWDSCTGETTDPEVVEALVEVIRDQASPEVIYLVESDGSEVRAKYAYRMLGYEQLAEKLNLELVNLSHVEAASLELESNDPLLQKVTVPELLTSVDLFISVPKLKLHSLTKITCALKNQFGCIPFRRKVLFHERIHEIIALINKIVRPNLVLVDGIIALSDGPKRLNLLMASEDPVAVDSVAAKIVGLNPETVKYITLSEELGVGSMNWELAGEDLHRYAEMFPQRSFFCNLKFNLAVKLYNLYLRYFTLEGKLLGTQTLSPWER